MHNNNSTRLPTQLLWGVSIIILALLFALSVFFYLNIKAQHSQQLSSLRENLMQAQRNRLAAEMDDAVHMIDQMFAEATDLLKHESRNQTRQALELMNSLYQRYHQQLSESEMKQMLVEALRDIRFFDGRGYYFIDQMDGISVLLPTAPQLEGRSLLDNRDDTGHYIMRGLISAVSNQERAGFSHYRWFAPGDSTLMKDKIAYVEVFEPYSWIVGAGDYLYRFENDIEPQVFNYIRNVRFGNSGYIALASVDGVLLASGATPEREGVYFLNDSDPVIRKSVIGAIDTANAGGGYLTYQWYKSGSNQPSQKLSLIEPLQYRGWFLIAGIFQDELDQLMLGQQHSLDLEIKKSAFNLIFALSVIGLMALVVTFTYSRWLMFRIKRYENDINRQQNALRKTADSLKLSGLIVDSAYEGIIVCDSDTRILQVNSAFTRITGYQQEEVIGKTPAMLSSGSHDDAFYRGMWKSLGEMAVWRGEIWNKRKSGEIYPQWLSISAYKDQQGEVQNYVAIFYDITQRKEMEKQLRDMAETDPLTGLANRRSLMECLTGGLSKGGYRSSQIALLFVDLDLFKRINDTYGHDVGDTVLIEVASRLNRCLRESDLASRVGGDEFIITIKLRADEGLKPLHQICKRLLAELARPVCIVNIEIDLSCSIGVAVDSGNKDAFALMKNADQALYEAKRQGRGRVVFYEDTLETIACPSPAEAENP